MPHHSIMLWQTDYIAAPALPGLWLIATGETARTLPERSTLRQKVSRRLIALQTGLDLDEVAIEHDRAGKPIIGGKAAGFAAMSHAVRSGFVAVGLGVGAIGVDVERVGDGPIPMQALHRAEQLWLAQCAGSERARRFAELWAAKEAHGKWAGTGLVEPDRTALLPERDGSWRAAGGPQARIETCLVERGEFTLALAVALTA